MAGLSWAAGAIAKVALGAAEIQKVSLGAAEVWSAITFQPSGMTKNGTQNFTTSWALLTGWTANTGTYPGSTVVNNALDVQGGKTGATISVSLPYTGSFTNPHTARILLNGVVIATGTPNGAASGTMTATATDVAVVDTDKVSVEVMVDTYANGSVSAGGTVTIT
ncbi:MULTISPECIES: hypothetical protein [Rhodococcus]|uniref:hypothetical protein n=1 Tax=Rhodococcus TaxID=1827 RepID=UPI000C7DE3B2|nr:MULTISPECIES: hypothetical protein [Rhodococcus]AUM18213.1 hypothetical protein CSW53_17780 [Rhodococcus ruber]